MRKIAIILMFLFSISEAYAQKSKDYLFVYENSKNLFGYKNKSGKVVIKAKYNSAPDTMFKMAIVLKNWTWVAIDRNENVLFYPFIYDNGPDYVEEGLFRFKENNKMGFANLNGQKIIQAKYSFVLPFKDGIAKYYIGGEEVYENGKTKKQMMKEGGTSEMHWTWGGNITETGYLNKYGQNFRKITELKNGKRQAWTIKNKHVLLNKKGQVIKE